MNQRAYLFRTALVFLAACWPWLHPGARGPTPTVEPLLVSLVCVAMMLAVASWAGPLRVARGIVGACIGCGLVLVLADGTARGQWAVTPAIAAAWLAMAAVAACAIVAASLKASEPSPGAFAETLAWAWLAAGVASTVIAFMQVAGWSGSLGGWVAGSPQRDAIANLRQRNHFATLAAIALLCVPWLVLHARQRLPLHLAGALVLLLCGGIAASASRTGALELMAVVALAAWWHLQAGKSPKWLLLPLAGYALAALGLMAVFRGSGAYLGILRRLTDGVPECPSRTVLWQNMASLALDRPWTGWGWRELSHAFYQGTFEPRFCAHVDNAHNLPLHLAVELGLPVALAFVAACTLVVWRARPWFERDAARLLAWGVLALIAMHSLAEFPLWYGPFQMALGLSVGLLVPPTGWRCPRPAGLAAAFVLALAAIYVAFDFQRVGQLYLPPALRAPDYREDTLAKARASWLFQDHVAYAELRGTPLIRENAARMFELAGRVMHFSPEPSVIMKRIHAARLLGMNEEADAEAARFRAAYPNDYATWAARCGSLKAC